MMMEEEMKKMKNMKMMLMLLRRMRRKKTYEHIGRRVHEMQCQKEREYE